MIYLDNVRISKLTKRTNCQDIYQIMYLEI